MYVTVICKGLTPLSPNSILHWTQQQ